MPKETMHDVYCSQCGSLTMGRSRNNAEGGALHITQAAARTIVDIPYNNTHVRLQSLRSADYSFRGRVDQETMSQQEVCQSYAAPKPVLVDDSPALCRLGKLVD